jgi:hypothetical protein
MDLLLNEARMEPARSEERAKAEERLRRYQFAQKAQKFVTLWGELTRQFENGKADVKLMHRVSAAFHDLEKTDGWRK